MNFKEFYQASARARKMANTEISPEVLIPNIYQYDKSYNGVNSDQFLHLLGGGTIKTRQLFSFLFQPLKDCMLLLYTTRGSGSVTCLGQTLSISQNSLITLDCSIPFSLQSMVLPWDFKLFFITGKDLRLYQRTSSSQHFLQFTLPEYSPLVREISTLLKLPSVIQTTEIIRMHCSLTMLLGQLFIAHSNEPMPTPGIPDYLVDMKNFLDSQYAEPFLLKDYEARYQINKYRICREFSKYFGASPLRYLNLQRLEQAKKMLLTTDLNIGEISSIIGYPNTNSFINLFKKVNNITPGAFRQKALTAQPVSHCPVQ